MPTYEYQCPDCSHRFEAVQKISENPLTDCPKCGGSHVKRLISATAFHLKGSGWYKTDYASGSSSSTSSGGGASSSSGSTGSAEGSSGGSGSKDTSGSGSSSDSSPGSGGGSTSSSGSSSGESAKSPAAKAAKGGSAD